MRLAVNIALIAVYVLGGICLEKLCGIESPAFFSFYGFMMAVLAISIDAHMDSKN